MTVTLRYIPRLPCRVLQLGLPGFQAEIEVREHPKIRDVEPVHRLIHDSLRDFAHTP